MPKYRSILFRGIAFFVSLLAFGCSDPVYSEIEQGVRVIGYMVSPRRLILSSYSALFPDGGKPSDFVSYIFSDIGVAEWPESEANAEESEMIREQARAIGAPLIPKDVVIVPLSVNLKLGKQVVVKFDDERGVVIAEGYSDPNKKPILVREWKLPKVRPAAGVEEMAQGQLQTGMSERSF